MLFFACGQHKETDGNHGDMNDASGNGAASMYDSTARDNTRTTGTTSTTTATGVTTGGTTSSTGRTTGTTSSTSSYPTTTTTH